MLFSSPILDMVSVSNNHERGQDPGGTLLYKSYTYLPPRRVGFMGRFGGLKSTLPILVWNRVRFSRKLRERTCAYVFIVFNSR